MLRRLLQGTTLITLLIFFSSVSIVWARSPRFINYPRPPLTVDFTPFVQSNDCVEPDVNGFTCTPGTPLYEYCDTIRKPSDLLGALTPTYPITTCYINTSVFEARNDIRLGEKFIYAEGGLYQSATRYVILQDGRYHLIDTEEALADMFAPIDNEEEAISYVLAARNLRAYYGLRYNRALMYHTRHVEDTHAHKTDTGYEVHLFSYQAFGCSPATTLAVTLHVTEDGVITERDRQTVFRAANFNVNCR